MRRIRKCKCCFADISHLKPRFFYCDKECVRAAQYKRHGVGWKKQLKLVTPEQVQFLIAFAGKTPEEIATYDSYKALQIIGETLENRRRQKA